jgi:hypothetical protein
MLQAGTNADRKTSYMLVPLWLIGVPLPAMMVLYLLFH